MSWNNPVNEYTHYPPVFPHFPWNPSHPSLPTSILYLHHHQHHHPALLPVCGQTLIFFLSFWEKETATHSSILAWRVSWTGEPCGLWSLVSRKSDTTDHTAQHLFSYLFSKLGYKARFYLEGGIKEPFKKGFQKSE